MTKKPPALLAAEKAIRLLGGPVQAARTLNVGGYQTVQQWGLNGVPLAHCASVEKALEGSVRRQDLRPDDFGTIWPELVKPNPPAAPDNTAQAAIETIAGA
jgi:DNA-binding transcriptional regulator YdaS (Cro superfamily)